jgi:ribonucleoside-diphosphate reductase alpha chain
MTASDDSQDKKEFTYEQAYRHSLEYFNGNELAAKVFVDKYALRNKTGLMEQTPAQMHDRLALEFARIDAKYGADKEMRFVQYRNALDKFARIVPQGSPMAAIGNPFQILSASNCLVIASPEDSISGIFRAGQELAQLFKRRAGTGIDISTLRPDGMPVNNAARTTTGAWSFAEFYSFVTKMIAQKGRRGALMITMDVHHPDVVKFATMKHDLTKVNHANVSIRLSDEFMKAVDEDKEYEQRFPCEGEPSISKKVRARDVWNVIVDSATKTAEPGLIFWDAMLRNLPAHTYKEFKSLTTNPCSEIILSAYDSCRLVSINLTGYVRNAFDANKVKFDFDAFKEDVTLATRMCDNIVDIELELIARIRDAACSDEMICDNHELRRILGKAGVPQEYIDASLKKITDFSETGLWDKLWQAGNNGRRTGLGTHGLADTLAQLRIKYDSDSAVAMVNEIYRTLRDEAYAASVELAKERGSFPVFDWETERDCDFIKRLPPVLQDDIAKYGRRNISLLTQAPTGSVSLLSKVGESNYFNVSSGVEPVFRNKYTRRKKVNEGDQDARVDFVDATGDAWQHFEVHHGNVDYYLGANPDKSIDALPDFFVTSDEIDWQSRVTLQGAEQVWIDHSISSTINLPKDTKPDVVGGLYLEAWKGGLKGVTVYVDGSRDGVLISEADVKDEEIKKLKGEIDDLRKQKNNPAPKSVRSPKRPELLPSETHKVKVDFGDDKPRNAYVTVSFFPGTKRPYEILIIAPYSGLSDKDLQILELTARTTSMNLRHGLPLLFICEQLDKIGGQYIFSLPTNISKVLRHYLSEDKNSIPPESVSFWEAPEEPEPEEPEGDTKTGEVTWDDGGLSKCPNCHKRTYRMTGQVCGQCEDPDCLHNGCG